MLEEHPTCENDYVEVSVLQINNVERDDITQTDSRVTRLPPAHAISNIADTDVTRDVTSRVPRVLTATTAPSHLRLLSRVLINFDPVFGVT